MHDVVYQSAKLDFFLQQVGMDYTALREHLKAGDFRKADDETRALLIRLAGEAAIKRGWVYFSEVSTAITCMRAHHEKRKDALTHTMHAHTVHMMCIRSWSGSWSLCLGANA